MHLLSVDEVFPIASQLEITASGIPPDLLSDSACGLELRAYLALTSGALGSELTSQDRLYNRYYYFLRFAQAYFQKFGPNVGIEQQAFQILENADCCFDLKEISRLEAGVRPAK
jgi:hypothetical protein